MKLKCEIELPQNYTAAEKLNAMAKASWDESMWHPVYSRKEVMEKTSMEDKCGSCKYFCPLEKSSRGKCSAGRVWGERTRPKCKLYERKAE